MNLKAKDSLHILLIVQELLGILDRISGSKVLVWDECLTGPIGLIAEYSVLKEHDVIKMFPLNPSGLPAFKADNVVFIIRPTVSNCDIISANIRLVKIILIYDKLFLV